MPRVVLNKNRDFTRLYSKGKYYVSPGLVTYVMKNKAPSRNVNGILLRKAVRVGITTSKKIGGAVQRNRSRRVISAAYRELAGELTPGWDIVFVARSRTCHMKSTEIKKSMREHLRSAGVLARPTAENQ